jgi:hypothetical protein
VRRAWIGSQSRSNTQDPSSSAAAGSASTCLLWLVSILCRVKCRPTAHVNASQKSPAFPRYRQLHSSSSSSSSAEHFAPSSSFGVFRHRLHRRASSNCTHCRTCDRPVRDAQLVAAALMIVARRRRRGCRRWDGGSGSTGNRTVPSASSLFPPGNVEQVGLQVGCGSLESTCSEGGAETNQRTMVRKRQ